MREYNVGGDWIYAALGFAVGTWIALALLVLVGCATIAPVPVPPVLGCLPAPPPALRPVHFAGVDEGCPAECEACLGPVDALALEVDVHRLQRYAAEAWARCGVDGASEPER